MSDAMKLSIDEVLNEAIMSSTPAIIVEGIDDLKTYIALAKDALDDFEVYAVETIDGYSGGCDQIVSAIRDLYQLNDAIHPVENFVLGVIDRDVREFRNELPSEAAIFPLRHYSIESHFVCKEVFEAALFQYTRVHPDKLGPEFAQNLFADIEQQLLDLYYFSLEALKGAVEPGYNADFKYSYNAGRRKQEPTRSDVLAKAAQLDQVAAQFQLQPNLESLKKVAHGKWLLTAFCEVVHSVLSSLSVHCGKYGSEQCDFCRVSILGKCTYRIKEGVSNKTLYSVASENTQLASLDYIRHRMSNISLQTLDSAPALEV